MKFVSLFFASLALVACGVSHKPLPSNADGRIVEKTILWQAETDSSWKPTAMAELVENEKKFKKEGNFYKVNGDLVVFGHQALYLGLLGVDMFPGPNAVLNGSPDNIAAHIRKHYSIKMEKHGDVYGCDYKEHIKIGVARHPSIKNASIVIGAYVGP